MKKNTHYSAPAVLIGNEGVFAVPALLATAVAAVGVGIAAKAIRGDHSLSSIPVLEPCID